MRGKIEADWKKLLYELLRSGMDDYIKLQPAKFRNKTYMQEAFEHAVAMFFDGSYQFLYIENPETGNPMSVKEMYSTLLDDDRIEIEKMRKHLISEAKSFWETKLLHTVNIPDNFVYDGHVYAVKHIEEEPSIDLDEKIIYINKKVENTENQQAFVWTVMQIAAHHEELTISPSVLRKISQSVFKILRMNGCFTNE